LARRETHLGAAGCVMEGLEHRSQHGIDVLSQDTSGVVERSSELGSGEVVVAVTVEVGEGGSVDHVVAVGIVGTRSDRVSVPDCSRIHTEDGSTSGSLPAEEVVTKSLVGEEARHLPDTGLVVAT